MEFRHGAQRFSPEFCRPPLSSKFVNTTYHAMAMRERIHSEIQIIRKRKQLWDRLRSSGQDGTASNHARSSRKRALRVRGMGLRSDITATSLRTISRHPSFFAYSTSSCWYGWIHGLGRPCSAAARAVRSSIDTRLFRATVCRFKQQIGGEILVSVESPKSLGTQLFGRKRGERFALEEIVERHLMIIHRKCLEVSLYVPPIVGYSHSQIACRLVR